MGVGESWRHHRELNPGLLRDREVS
jgi:hypothetical protein